MPEDYQDIVLAAYKKMKNKGKLHEILPEETTTRLRKACLKVYDSRNNPNDIDILSTFFKVDKMKCDNFRKVIDDSEPDDYRALCKHIKGETETTDERNSNLLAWLIDLEPRPRSSYYYSSTEKALKIGGIPIDDLFPPPTPPDKDTTKPDPKQPKAPVYVPKFTQAYITISCIILLLVVTASFAFWERRAITVRKANSDEKFMYWDEDHYEPIKDEKQNVGSAIIPLNVQTLTSQRKINLPDTLTSYSIGKVWYKGHGKDHEFFTYSGAYPQDLQRVLKPLTNNILTKYTSNDRYMLTRLVWFICAAFFTGLCGFAVSKLEKEVKPAIKEIETETEKEEIPEFHGNELQATNT
ncbi:hypothetical protein OQX63_12715 [Pedobacter sp. PF22-3]|uniref:hypothetical protein n=1 Tax=Pedobacter sp. PF22-3 TaxID=2994467 RepID=UPI002247C2A7|nr:hypothetical protein [Pedobacter sp. PF22-3]MCX2494342.1 hypothetical protein [Pedobacter sp. PF22-3]